jgi:hypothetical protein
LNVIENRLKNELKVLVESDEEEEKKENAIPNENDLNES